MNYCMFNPSLPSAFSLSFPCLSSHEEGNPDSLFCWSDTTRSPFLCVFFLQFNLSQFWSHKPPTHPKPQNICLPSSLSPPRIRILSVILACVSLSLPSPSVWRSRFALPTGGLNCLNHLLRSCFGLLMNQLFHSLSAIVDPTCYLNQINSGLLLALGDGWM